MNAIHDAQSHCRFGIAFGEMTPPVGIYHRMWGAAKHDKATGIHRPLRATVLSFAPRSAEVSIQQTQIVIAIDHCILGQRELKAILDAVTSRTGLTEDQIVVVCSHTHAAGLLSLDRVELPGGELIPDYLSSLAQTVGQLAEESLGNLQPANVTYGTGSCRLAANRDYWDDESQQFVCGYNSETPADDTLMVARVESEQRNPIATLVNYACHPTTLAWDNTLISPDFPGALRELVEAETEVPCVFLQGASGELGPREGFVGDVGVADCNGRELGFAALSVLQGMPRSNHKYHYAGPVVSGATIGTWAYRPLTGEEQEQTSRWSHWRGAIDLPFRPDLAPLDEIVADLDNLELQETEAIAKGDSSSVQKFRALAERRRRELARRQSLPAGEVYPYQAAIWRMGDAVWLCVQGEPYSLLQTELRKRFPQIPIIVASLGFSWGVAYLPPADKYGLGLYQENIAIVAPGSLETAIDTLAQRIEALLGEP